MKILCEMISVQFHKHLSHFFRFAVAMVIQVFALMCETSTCVHRRGMTAPTCLVHAMPPSWANVQVDAHHNQLSVSPWWLHDGNVC